MNDPSPRLDMHRRPVKVEVIDCRDGWWTARIWSGPVILRETRIHSSENEAARQGERWLTKYLETGSWTEATDWHEKNYWHTPEGSSHKPENSSHKGEGTPVIEPAGRSLFDAFTEAS